MQLSPTENAGASEPSLSDHIWSGVNVPDLVLFGGVVLTVVTVLVVARRVVDKTDRTRQFGQQVTMAVLTLVGIAAIVLALPVEASLIESLLGLIGLLLSAMLALSATTIVGNALAGLMLRSLRNFKPGEFIRCGEHFGRVTEQGLIHTEIQTEDSDLTTLPNLFLVTNPLTTVRSKGTIISATVSLGYDISRGEIDRRLVAAGNKVGLTDPFVLILELGDHSVVYRLAGFTTEVNQMLTLRSRLRGAMMDELHAAGIEIVSPNFMNQRLVERDVIPDTSAPEPESTDTPTQSVFDKAEAAESHESVVAESAQLKEEISELQGLIKTADSEEQKASLLERKEAAEKRLARFHEVIERNEEEKKSE